jgi:N-formylglutamate amidohydrolase
MTYSVFNPEPSIPVVANVPHASSAIPDEVRDQFIISDQQLHEEQRLLVDWFTDELYAPIQRAGGCIVRHGVSRFVLDPERFEDDSQEVMAARGMGALYTHGCHRQEIRRQLSAAEREVMLAKYYRPYHAELISRVSKTIERFGRCFVIDCHSYPQNALPYELHGDSERPDIVLGTDTFHTPQAVIALIEDVVQKAGYSFGLDRPFAGTYVPLPMYKDPRVVAFMLEINRGAYMDETSTAKHEGFAKIEAVIGHIVEQLQDIVA